MKKRIISMAAAIILLAGICGCGTSQKTGTAESGTGNTTITLAYDSSNYGENWVNEAVSFFKKEEPDVNVKLLPEKDIISYISSSLSSGGSVPDVVVMTSTNWQYYAKKGLLLKLDEVYKSEEDGKTLSQRLQTGLEDYGKYNGSYYVIPWSVEVGGILYNSSMFKKYGWQVPSTYEELFKLMSEMKLQGITPFAWAGKSANLWDHIVLGWWAMYEGKSGVDTFLKMKSPEVYAQKGRLVALKQFENIVLSSENCISGAAKTDESSMMATFFNGKAAMVTGDSSFAAKYGDSAPDNFVMKMMKLPAPDGALDSDLTAMFVQDFICIPAGAENPGLAEKFVEFLCERRSAMRFEQTAKTPSALNISFLGSDSFTSSVSDIYETTSRIYIYSKSELYYSRFLDWPSSGKPYLQISSGIETAQSIFDKNYAYAKENWDNDTQ